MITQKILEKSLRFLITSTIRTASETELNEEDQNEIINLQFNMLVNMLQPEYALMFIDELLKISGNIDLVKEMERSEILEEILKRMKEV